MHSDDSAPPVWPRVIGQSRVKRLLLTAIAQDRLAHAYLFHGPEGVGKDALAFELALALHCERGGEEGCGVCPSCVRVRTLQHPDVRLVTALPLGKAEQSDDAPLAKLGPEDIATIRREYREKAGDPYRRVSIPRANIIKINSIREIRREAPMSTSAGRRRIFILSRAEEMGEEAANTLLKTLEEPAGRSMLVLTSAHPHALLPTIRSRCQQIACDALTDDAVAHALEERRGVAHEQAVLVARLAAGSYGRAVELLDEDLARERSDVLHFIRQAVSGHPVAVAQFLDDFPGTRDREAAARFLRLLLLWFRDALVMARGGSVVNVDQTEDLRRFVDRFAGADLVGVILGLERAVFLLERNVYIKLVFWDITVLLRRLILRSA